MHDLISIAYNSKKSTGMKLRSIFSWTPNQKIMIINLLVHSLLCT